MRWLRGMRVRNKILTGFFAVLALLLASAIVAWVQTNEIEEANQEYERADDLLDAVEALRLALTDRIGEFRYYMITGQPEALQRLRAANDRVDRSLAEAREFVSDPQQEAQLDSVAAISAEVERDVIDPALELRRTVAPETGGLRLSQALGATGFEQGRQLTLREREILERVMASQQERTADRRADLERSTELILYTAFLALVIAAGAALVIAIFTANSISKPLIEAVHFAGVVSEGDLRDRMEVYSNDEVGVLRGTLNRMATDLAALVGEINGSAEHVVTAAQQIEVSSERLNDTIDAQVAAAEDTSSSMEEIAAQITTVAESAASLATSVDQTSSSISQMSRSIEATAENADRLGSAVEETSVTMEEMAASAEQVGRNVEETRSLAAGAESDAREGGEAVQRTIDAMRRIQTEMGALVSMIEGLDRSTGAVSEISELIEDLADRTDLLALNASIEAARAGEHGRGFSVVAGEIRRLAERAVESAQEITATIESIRGDAARVVSGVGALSERTEEGAELATEAGRALEKIIDSAGRTRQLMEDVRTAVGEQVEASQQVRNATELIRSSAESTRIATNEQAGGSRQIVRAVEDMNRQTQAVFAATAEQKRGGALVVEATEAVTRGAREAQGAVRDLVRSAQSLGEQAARLRELIARFRV